jgi:hypothetical protein
MPCPGLCPYMLHLRNVRVQQNSRLCIIFMPIYMYGSSQLWLRHEIAWNNQENICWSNLWTTGLFTLVLQECVYHRSTRCGQHRIKLLRFHEQWYYQWTFNDVQGNGELCPDRQRMIISPNNPQRAYWQNATLCQDAPRPDQFRLCLVNWWKYHCQGQLTHLNGKCVSWITVV